MDADDRTNYDTDNSEEEELVDKELRDLEDEPDARSVRETHSSKSRKSTSKSSRLSRDSSGSSKRGSVKNISFTPMPQFLRERLKVDFVCALDKKYECPLCEEVLRYPVVFEECGHRCCSHCFENEVKRSDNRKCPVDQNKINVNAATIDKELNSVILAFEVKCSNHNSGCEWEGEYQQIQQHLQKCDYAEIVCPKKCGTTGIQKKSLEDHLQEVCPKAFVPCHYCEERTLREDKDEHLQECPKKPSGCPNKCDKELTMPKDEIEKHVEESCPKTKMSCDFANIGCEQKVSREKLPKHYKSEIFNHVKLIHKVALENQERLDQRDSSLLEHLECINHEDKRIVTLERVAHNAMVWRIEGFAEKLKLAKMDYKEAKDKLGSRACSKCNSVINPSNPAVAKRCDCDPHTLYSPCFTTSKHGYRMCASMCLNGDGRGKGTHMSVFVSLVKGAYDGLLKWPFTYPVTFYLLDQQDDPADSVHIERRIVPNPDPTNEPFLGRPYLGKNASFGIAFFAQQEVYETRRYVRDDVMFIKVVIEVDEASEP